MQIGSISAVIEYAMIIMFFMMLAQFAMLSVPRALACLARTSEVLSVRPQIQDAAAPAALPTGERDELPREVARFDHATFRFPDAD